MNDVGMHGETTCHSMSIVLHSQETVVYVRVSTRG